ncbi:MAG: response regulator [Halobacteriales archaeon]|nr:response regulator [Halobacteriales archaeon]
MSRKSPEAGDGVVTEPDEKEDGKISVLHVDDSSEFVEIASTYLSKTESRLDIETETDPVDALERLEEDEFDCVISDCSMPGMAMDGVGLHEAVREENPTLPFVFFTGTSRQEFPNTAVNDGVTGHVRKEIDLKQFSNLAGWITDAVR